MPPKSFKQVGKVINSTFKNNYRTVIWKRKTESREAVRRPTRPGAGQGGETEGNVGL